MRECEYCKNMIPEKMRICPHCGKPTRLGHKIEADGTKSRVCKNADCGKTY